MTNSYPTPPLPEWGSRKQKQRAQVKSRFYYLFWGAATAVSYTHLRAHET